MLEVVLLKRIFVIIAVILVLILGFLFYSKQVVKQKTIKDLSALQGKFECKTFLREEAIQNIVKMMDVSDKEKFEEKVCDCLIDNPDGKTFKEFMSDKNSQPYITECMKKSIN